MGAAGDGRDLRQDFGVGFGHILKNTVELIRLGTARRAREEARGAAGRAIER